jgi:mannose-6-phosphate isomerase-like protein (cupin superfamily)
MTNYTEQRPWGQFENIVDNPNIKVKFITVNPGQRLSYQYHNKRCEYWFVISGVGTFTVKDKTLDYPAGSTIYIPMGDAHRMANNGSEPLVVLEVQRGTYFGEDDIVRLSDDYGR